jgi:hypothetical protein
MNGTFARHQLSIISELKFPGFQIIFDSLPRLGRYSFDLVVELVAVSIGSLRVGDLSHT